MGSSALSLPAQLGTLALVSVVFLVSLLRELKSGDNVGLLPLLTLVISLRLHRIQIVQNLCLNESRKQEEVSIPNPSSLLTPPYSLCVLPALTASFLPSSIF